MSKGKKQRYKQYTIETPEDGCLVLKSLIVPVIHDLEKFKRYSDEAEALLDEYKSEKEIPAELYESVHDKVLFEQRELLKLIADYQDSSFSYIGVRKILFARKKYLTRELEENVKEILNELLDIRNWTFHNAQSMLVAQQQVAKNAIPAELSGMATITPMLNPVVIDKVESYSIELLISFVVHNRLRYNQFEMVLLEMKRDYQELYESLPNKTYHLTDHGFSCEIQYIERKISGLNHKKAGADVAELSMKIQKGKYEG